MLELHGKEHVFSIAARDFLNTLSYREGRLAEARASTLLLIDDLARLFGESTPLIANLQIALAKLELGLNNSQEGLAALEVAEPLIAGLNPDHAMLVEVYTLRAELCLLAADVEAAATAGAEAVRRTDAFGDAGHPVVSGAAHLALAKAKRARGDAPASVRKELERARSLFSTLPSHPDAKVDEVDTLLETI